ncbi:MAG: ABC transporter permease [Planctomycetaceae bacterium]|nr:ABC transporter permease [Planctomycetaceae bacterium]
MTAYLIRRLLYMVPIVIGVLLATFVLFKVVGGDISQQIAGKNADLETIAEVRHEYGFDKPLFAGLTPLAGDDWQAARQDYTAAIKNERQVRAESENRSVLPISAFDLDLKAQRKWLGDLFRQRLNAHQFGGALEMITLDSQFSDHFKHALTFNFGRALDREKISDKILLGVGPSLSLTIPMFIGTLVVSISMALLVAFLRGTVWDYTIVILCIIGLSIPYLSFIIFGQYFFAYKMDWFPIFYSPDKPMIHSIILPALIGIAAGLGGSLRFYRTVMLDEIRSDYVRTAFAKGLTTRKVLFKHVLKNAMIPIVTNVVLSIPFLVLGSLLLERFFGIPGIGYLMIEAINARDFFVLNALTFMMALLIAVFTLLTDICYAWVDPRVTFD